MRVDIAPVGIYGEACVRGPEDLTGRTVYSQSARVLYIVVAMILRRRNGPPCSWTGVIQSRWRRLQRGEPVAFLSVTYLWCPGTPQLARG